MSTNAWDHTVDVLVVGSGAGAMVAGLTAHDLGASTLLIEKSPQYGGSSAMSGGGLWVPNNHLMERVGIKDSPEDAFTYIKATTGGAISDEHIRAYVENGPKMVRYLSDRSRLVLVAMGEYPDYFPEQPGSRPGGRALEPEAFDARLLGDEFLHLRETAIQERIMGRILMTVRDARLLMCKSPGWMKRMAELMSGYWLDIPWRFKSNRDRNLAMGNALVGALRCSLMDRGVPLWVETPARELVTEQGRVVGVVAERNGRAFRIRANQGVILGTGGFESSQIKREKYLPSPTRAEWTCGNPYNTGDAVDMGLAVGAALDLMDEAWWGPTTVVPGEARARMLVIEKSLPGSILVDQRGQRFVNEALSYDDVVKAMYRTHNVPCYLIFDARFRKSYPVGPFLPSGQQPDWALPGILKRSYLKKADTIEGLGQLMSIDVPGLLSTIRRFNEHARAGVDQDFHRGESVFQTYYGDANVKPNPCLAPLDKPPFYAMECFAGELGTKGGLKMNPSAQVLHQSGEPIPGLYAIGNCSAAVMGRTYPGPGATIGPATTFGFIAAHHAVGK